jgi:signal transduction histidine kinase
MTTALATNNHTKALPTLLVVDDEAGPRESLRIVFKDRFNVVLANDGREAIAYAREHPVDIAILDIRMPDISGVEVLRELKQLDPNTEVVMLTGYETLETARAAVRYGAADYLNKPFDVFSIRDVLEKCAQRRTLKLEAERNLRALRTLNAELQRELAEINRTQSVGALSAGVVHELNNPLSIIAAYAQILDKELQKSEPLDDETLHRIRERLKFIQREVERCKAIARRFLNFSRLDATETQRVKLAMVLDDAVALLRAHPSNAGVTFDYETPDENLHVDVHPSELLQVLINLGINALQAMQNGGTLRIRAERLNGPFPKEGTPNTALVRSSSFSPDAAAVRISVADTGCGIAPDNLSKIFEPYFTTKPFGEGTGLGLFVVVRLMEKSRGLVCVESEVGKGATFNLFLPLSRT